MGCRYHCCGHHARNSGSNKATATTNRFHMRNITKIHNRYILLIMNNKTYTALVTIGICVMTAFLICVGFVIGKNYQQSEQIVDETTAAPEVVYVSETENEAYQQFQQAKLEWLAKNPPVDELFDRERRMDVEYLVDYIRRNPPAGDCALNWIPDVVCWEWGRLSFPESRN